MKEIQIILSGAIQTNYHIKILLGNRDFATSVNRFINIMRGGVWKKICNKIIE